METIIETIPAKNIIFKNKSPDQWFGLDYNMNIYRGCSHGCIYCDSRSDCYKVTDFDTVKVKKNALEIIRNDLRRKVKTGVVGSGAMSDPYNPLEKELKLTRNSLELINAFSFGIGLTTKSDLIARDADILQDIKSHSPVIALFSISTADDELCKKLEPNVSPASKRFEAMNALAEQGIFCGVLIVPLLPYVSDTEDNIVQICRMAKEAGAKFVYTYMGMTLRSGNREYYYEHIDNIMPGTTKKYNKRFGLSYICTSYNAKGLFKVFTTECERLGLLYNMKAIIYHYKAGYGSTQLTLF
ncbi:MAG: radical SAM protein [Defluviitaleaceae bacterium]|nr:radical SAM protein [Defluviitaleaceae bacterium]